MTSDLRNSGIGIIGDIPWSTHICQFFQTKEDLIDILVPYFKAGLENNELCIWITSQPLEREEAIIALRDDIPNLDIYLEKGQIKIIPYRDCFPNEGVFSQENALKFWAEIFSDISPKGYEGIRFSGTNSWLNQENWDTIVIFEEQLDNTMCNYQMIALSSYSIDRHNIEEILYLGIIHKSTIIKSNGKWKLIECSKHKISEDIASRAKKDWENTFDAVPDLMSIIDSNHRIIRVNKAMASKFGLTPEECIGLTCYSIVHETSTPPPFCPYRQMLMDGLEHTIEVFDDCLGGFFALSTSPLYDSEGKLKGCVHVARDITERKKSEEKLKESEGKYRSIVETSNEGISLNDGKGHLTFVNKKMAKMLGYEIDEIINKNILDFVEDIDDSVATNSMQKQLQDDVQSYDFKLLRKDHSPLWVFVNIKSFFDNNGKFIGTLNMFTDVTERKIAEEKIRESEEKYRNIVETANEGIIIINKEAIITFANKRMEDIFGYARQQCIGKPIWDFLSEESKPIVKLKLKNRCFIKEDSYELKLLKKDGTLLWVLVNAKGLFDKYGEYLSTLSMVTDITIRKDAEQALENFEIAREKEIHHRIKNNFQIVSSLLDIQTSKFLCRNDIKELEVIEAFKECQSRVITMALIHEELYRGSRLENINFSEYIEKLTENLLLTYKLGNKDIKISRDLENDIFLDIDTAIPLGTLINELVTNSFKHAFIGKDKGEIWISLHREIEDFIHAKEQENYKDAKRTILILSVSDNGVGIPKNLNIENLDSLGLQLVTSLVDQLKGELEIKRNGGTEFIIRFNVIDKSNQVSSLVYQKV